MKGRPVRYPRATLDVTVMPVLRRRAVRMQMLEIQCARKGKIAATAPVAHEIFLAKHVCQHLHQYRWVYQWSPGCLLAKQLGAVAEGVAV
jgi:hypothetical protein